MTDARPRLIAFPMHGQHKLSSEGYRTRDGHLIEWFARTSGPEHPVKVVSRPEPIVLAPIRRFAADTVLGGTEASSTFVGRLPRLKDRQRWWVDSLPYYHRAVPSITAPVISWNPFLALSSIWPSVVGSGQRIGFDLLDDWTIHHAFAGIRKYVDRAYRTIFEHADFVTANAEGTLALAHRYGRSDASLLPNGCDPDRFDTRSVATGPLTVGYVGKIGKRLDLRLMLDAIDALPHVSFVLAGPVLDAGYRGPLKSRRNVRMLGDVHYNDVPALLTQFDIGWVPHNVGEGEVGGDVIKTYEYRAAGLPVLTTPVSGASSRGLDSVTVLESSRHVEWLAGVAAEGVRVARKVSVLPADVRWERKAGSILDKLGLS